MCQYSSVDGMALGGILLILVLVLWWCRTCDRYELRQLNPHLITRGRWNLVRKTHRTITPHQLFYQTAWCCARNQITHAGRKQAPRVLGRAIDLSKDEEGGWGDYSTKSVSLW